MFGCKMQVVVADLRFDERERERGGIGWRIS
jgi:hypothetical protein